VGGRHDPRFAGAVEPPHLRPSPGSPERGLRAEYFRGKDLQGEPVLTRVEPKVDFRWFRSAPTDDLVSRGELPAARGLATDGFSARFTGELLPPVTGEYELTLTANDGARLFLDGRPLIDAWSEAGVARVASAKASLQAGRAYALRLEYFENIRDAELRLGWTVPGAASPFEEALRAARAADVVVFVGGLTAEVEGEEMTVSFPGFEGGDRTDIELPESQQKLLEALHATGKPVVLVLLTGSALAVNWAEEKLPAIVVGWYPGQEGGAALADVLFGDVSPAGRLPVTFYRSVRDLPAFTDYGMEGKTYRYFRGEPLYPFGHGLSYARFEYSDLRFSRTQLSAGDALEVAARVRNASSRDADEVVQLYVRDPASPTVVPAKELRGFTRLSLKSGESREVRFELRPSRDFARYDEGRKAFAVEPGEFEIELAASSRDVRLRGRVSVAE
jgi:beta-glucosidase